MVERDVCIAVCGNDFSPRHLASFESRAGSVLVGQGSGAALENLCLDRESGKCQSDPATAALLIFVSWFRGWYNGQAISTQLSQTVEPNIASISHGKPDAKIPKSCRACFS